MYGVQGRGTYTNNDTRYCISSSLISVYLHYFQQKGLGNNLTLRALNTSFSKKLVDLELISPNSIATNKVNASDLISYLDSISKFFDYASRPFPELVATNFPIERVFKIESGNCKINSLQDLIFYDHSKNIVKFVTFVDSSQYTDNLFGSTLKSCFNFVQLKRDLLGEDTIIKHYILDVFSIKETEVILDQSHRLNYPRVLKSIVTSIENKVFYPRASHSACASCEFKNKCNWSFE